MTDLITDLHRAKNEVTSLAELSKQIKPQIKGAYRQRAWHLQVINELEVIKKRITLLLDYEVEHDEKA